MTEFNSLTFGEMIGQVRGELGEVNEGYFTDEHMSQWINLAQLDFARRTGLCKTSAQGKAVDGQQKYSLATDYLRMEKVFWQGRNLRFLDEHQLLVIADQDRLIEQGTPSHYYLRGAADSGLCLWLYKVPNVTDGAGDYSIVTWYHQAPPKLVSKADVSIVPGRFHHAICTWAHRLGRIKRREMVEAKELWGLYMEYVTDGIYERQVPTNDRPQEMNDGDVWSYQGVGDESVISEL